MRNEKVEIRNKKKLCITCLSFAKTQDHFKSNAIGCLKKANTKKKNTC